MDQQERGGLGIGGGCKTGEARSHIACGSRHLQFRVGVTRLVSRLMRGVGREEEGTGTRRTPRPLCPPAACLP